MSSKTSINFDHHRCGYQICGYQRRGARGDGVHRQGGDRFALCIATRHHAGGRALCCTHAVAEHDDDVLDLLATGEQRYDFEVALRGHGLAIALRGSHGERVDAGLGHAHGTHRGQCGIARHIGQAILGAGLDGDRAFHGFSVDREGGRRDGLGCIVRTHRGLQVKALSGQEASNYRALIAAAEKLAGRGQTADGGRRLCARGEQREADGTEATCGSEVKSHK